MLYAFQTSLNQVVKLQQEELHRLELNLRNMNAKKDKDAFLDMHKAAFAAPDTFHFHPHGGDDVSLYSFVDLHHILTPEIF